ncbi:hypothetical protein ACQKEK_02340 [Pseudomonas sp. NPDC077408]|uniref:hypothetical protein n=1 Tax=Streptomyces parvus TaxID=66428 RepID=UPI00371EC32A
MKQHGPIGRREQPCPEYSESDADLVREALDAYDADTLAAYAAFASDKLDQPLELVASLVPGLVGHQRWESHRGLIGRFNPDLAEYLGELAMAIDKQQAAFIEHRAAQMRSKAEEIKHEEAA